ncbi:hypothetical protein E2C01_067973 [Portunus trituberculatus]|uniref:Uncharacterized protein n=1 Tax=Portunus trituberculatus TaxID=210409 RepID=A0A5B7HWN4_PORTR|nr:hypothetical protein [Portunus trituberculatus]
MPLTPRHTTKQPPVSMATCQQARVAAGPSTHLHKHTTGSAAGQTGKRAGPISAPTYLREIKER